MELAALIAFLNSPLGAAAIVLAGLFFPKLGAVVNPLLNLLKKAAPTATPAAPVTPAPAAPAPGAPAPAPVAVPEVIPGRPLINAGLALLAKALAKRTGASEADALEKFIVTEASRAHIIAEANAPLDATTVK
ncbi:hypothetical protein R5W23_000852 [Gemmata sp. JC673]|uniref:Uncharacterized protein n=1 Tax=Gemmata algarum TaxID=2975278 RepID=A0ABU5EWP5_9BACT|nr:hypothetical protein [Gemmata algarum]MDY3558131.1 hypothetical protein [Gemmata algarum]